MQGALADRQKSYEMVLTLPPPPCVCVCVCVCVCACMCVCVCFLLKEEFISERAPKLTCVHETDRQTDRDRQGQREEGWGRQAGRGELERTMEPECVRSLSPSLSLAEVELVMYSNTH